MFEGASIQEILAIVMMGTSIHGVLMGPYTPESTVFPFVLAYYRSAVEAVCQLEETHISQLWF